MVRERGVRKHSFKGQRETEKIGQPLCIGKQVIIIKYGNYSDKESTGCCGHTHVVWRRRLGKASWKKSHLSRTERGPRGITLASGWRMVGEKAEEDLMQKTWAITNTDFS